MSSQAVSLDIGTIDVLLAHTCTQYNILQRSDLPAIGHLTQEFDIFGSLSESCNSILNDSEHLSSRAVSVAQITVGMLDKVVSLLQQVARSNGGYMGDTQAMLTRDTYAADCSNSFYLVTTTLNHPSFSFGVCF